MMEHVLSIEAERSVVRESLKGMLHTGVALVW